MRSTATIKITPMRLHSVHVFSNYVVMFDKAICSYLFLCGLAKSQYQVWWLSQLLIQRQDTQTEILDFATDQN